MKPLKFVIVSALLSACGGGAETPAVLMPVFSQVGSGTATVSEAASSATAIDSLNNAISSGAVVIGLPQASSARYNGVAGVTFASGTSVFGKMQLDADFSAKTVSGTSSDYIIEVSDAFGGGTVVPTGTISIDGEIVGPTFSADFDGNLTTGLGTYTLTSKMNGVFAKNGPENDVFGTIAGDVVSPDTSSSAISSGFFVGVAE